MPRDGRITLAGLDAAVDGCRQCDLWRDATQGVAGMGPPNARMILVGEQPGDQEDKAGEPFVGPAGRILDDALGEVGLDRRELYVTNAVKHFKWEARGKRRIHQRPNRTQVVACHDWLELGSPPCRRPRRSSPSGPSPGSRCWARRSRSVSRAARSSCWMAGSSSPRSTRRPCCGLAAARSAPRCSTGSSPTCAKPRLSSAEHRSRRWTQVWSAGRGQSLGSTSSRRNRKKPSVTSPICDTYTSSKPASR